MAGASRNSSARIILKARDDATAKIRVVRQVLGALGVTAAFVGSVQLGRVLYQGVKKAVGVFAEFDSQMASTAAVLGRTKDNIIELTEQSKLLGRTTAFTSGQVAQGQTTLAKAGFDVNEVFAAMPGTVNLAAAAEVSVGEAADIAAGLVRGFGLAASETTDIADLLAVAATSAKTDITELAEGFKFAVAPARSLGVSATETAAAMAILSDNMLGGSIGGTGLKKAFITMLGEVDKLEGALGLQGLEERLYTVNEQGQRIFIGLVPALRMLKENGIDAGKAFKVFGSRSGAIAAVLLRNIDLLEETGEAFKNRLGAAADLAGGKLDSLKGDTVKLNSAIEGLQLAIGEKLNPGLRVMAQDLTVVVNSMTDATTTGGTFLDTLDDISIQLFTAADSALRWADVIHASFRVVQSEVQDLLSMLLEGNARLAAIMQPKASAAAAVAKLFRLPGADALGELAVGLEDAALLSAKLAVEFDQDSRASAASIGTTHAAILKVIDAMREAQDLAAALRNERSSEFMGPPRRMMNPPDSGGATADRPATLEPGVLSDVDRRSQQEFVDEFFGGEPEEAVRSIASVFEEIAAEETRQRDELLELRVAAEEAWSVQRQELEREQLNREMLSEIENAETIGASIFGIEEIWQAKSDALDERYHQIRLQRDEEERRRKIQNAIAIANAASGLALAVFGESKSIRIADTIINTAAGIMRATVDPGGYAGIALAFLIGAMGAAQIAQIQKTNPQGFAFGGLVSGPGGLDRIPARLTAGEVVLNTSPSEGRALLDGRAKIVPAGDNGGGGGTYITINAVDAESFERMLERNPRALTNGIRNAALRGYI